MSFRLTGSPLIHHRAHSHRIATRYIHRPLETSGFKGNMDGRSNRRRESSISPPPNKRRRLTPPSATLTAGEDRSLSIYSWNVNGISPFLQPSITSFFKHSNSKGPSTAPPKASLRDFLRRHEWPQLLFLQEIKINPSDSATLRAVEAAVKRQSQEPDDTPDYSAHFCLPDDKYNARGFGRKVYGVCCIVREDFRSRFVDRIRPVDWDREGRFLVIETKARVRIPKLALINIYAVNGTENPYRDPESGVVVGTRHDRKLEVHRLLQEEIRSLEAQGFGVVLAGDLNIARATIDGRPNLRTFPLQHCLNRADFEERFFTKSESESEKADGGLEMIDTFRHLYPHKEGYTYYPRTNKFGDSCDRVDMIMVSRSLGESLVEAGMHETPVDRGPSDHVPLFAKLEFPGCSEDQKGSDGN